MIVYMRWFILISLLINSFSIWSQEEQIEVSFAFANALASNGNHHAATKHYLKAFYLDRSNEHPQTAYKVSQGFEKLGDLPNTLKYLDAYLKYEQLNEEQRISGSYKKVRLLLSHKMYEEAQVEMYQISALPGQLDTDRYYFYQSIIAIYLSNYKNFVEAIHGLSYFEELYHPELSDIVNDFQKNINTNHQKSRFLSAILPGLGQSLNNDLKDGVNSLVINLGTLIIFINTAQTLGFRDAVLSVGPWFGRYYLGGTKNAIKASKINQQKNKDKLIKRFAELCQNAQHK